MRDLASAYGRLNGEQKEAVQHNGNTVVLAGPGSGKTATLVVKVAHLLSSVVKPPQGVACITFNNDAVEEFRGRLAEFGRYAERRLYLGSVHSFCLNCVVRPYGPIVDPTLGRHVRVASERVATTFLESIAAARVPGGVYLPTYAPGITRLRRAKACGEDLSGFDDHDFGVVEEYERTLAEKGLVDFEAMVLRSVELIIGHDWIRRLIASRFPWLVVDEYQDLGGPLHRIVTALANLAGVRVFAVGDPDQTVYDFTGANPKYLKELAERPDFKFLRLQFNYRSGGDLIAASQAALAPEDGPRPYFPNPERKDRGRVEFRKASNDLRGHAATTLGAVREAIAAGTPPHEIAVLYRQKNELLPEIREVFDRSGIAYVAERDAQYPKSPLSRWLQRAAGWAVSPPDERETLFTGLLSSYVSLLTEAGKSQDDGAELGHRTRLHALLRDTHADAPLGAWLREANERLGLVDALQASCSRPDDDLDAFDRLLKEAGDGGYRSHRVRDFAADGRTRGKVVLTTLHGSKGRQFDVVVLPGLVEGVTPKWNWNRQRRQMESPEERALQESRRLFYVGFTRARHVVYLVYSSGYTNTKGYYNQWGPSRFAIEIAERLKEDVG